MAKLEWRPFNANDWRAYNGAECFPDGSPPLTTEWMTGTNGLAVAVVGPNRATVEVLEADTGEQMAHLVFESPLTVGALTEQPTLAELRALPGCHDLLS